MRKTMNYFSPDDIDDIAAAEKIEELVSIALSVLDRMPKPVCWVGGPMTTGLRTNEDNKERLRQTILRFKEQGATVFNYLPLQKKAMDILRREFGDEQLLRDQEHQLQERLRDELYAPIFESGKINELRIMPQSGASFNVQWMRGFARGKGITIKLIPEELVPKLKKSAVK